MIEQFIEAYESSKIIFTLREPMGIKYLIYFHVMKFNFCKLN
jgi:hypothetical protein